jgi:hypothetical protein
MRWSSLGILAMLTLSACATMSDVRRSQPARSGTFAASYKPLATCIVLAWNGQTNGAFQLIDDESNRRAIITTTPATAGAPMETTVSQMDPAHALVEIRQGTTLFEGLDGAWRDVTACAERVASKN